MNQLQEKGQNSFLYSDKYLILLAVVVFFAWQFRLEFVGMAILAIVISLVLLFNDDATPAVPAFATAVFIVSRSLKEYAEFFQNQDNRTILFVLVGVCAVMIIASTVVFIVKNKPKFKLGTQFVGFIGISLGFLFAGILYSTDKWLQGLPFVLAYLVLLWVLYFFFNTCITKLNKIYFAKIFFYIGIILTLQTFVCYASAGKPFEDIIKADVNLGWGFSNHIGAILLFCLPMCLYLAERDRRHMPCYLLVFLFQVIALLFTMSRGAILAAVIGLPVLIIWIIVKSQHKRDYFIVLGVLIVGLGVFVALKFDEVILAFERVGIISITSEGLKFLDSGRFAIYKRAIEDFLSGGWRSIVAGTSVVLRFTNTTDPYWYHNTALQFLANGGVIGGLGYLTHLFFKYKIFITKKGCVFNICAFIAVAMWSFYGLLDCSYFLPQQLILFIVIMVFAEKNLPEDYDPYWIFRLNF